MSRPGVSITVLNNQLGSVALQADKVMGLICTGPAPADLSLGESLQIFSLAEAEAVGITAAYDSAQTTDVYKQIKEFYDESGNGAELWIMVLAKTNTMTNILDKANNLAKKLLNDAGGRINVLGVCRVPDGSWEPSYDNGFDDDAYTAIAKAQQLAEEFETLYQPLRVVVGARDYQGVAADLTDLTEGTANKVGVLLASSEAEDLNACVGLLLGRLARYEAQEKCSKVKNGELTIEGGFMTDGVSVETYKTSWNSIYDKGYISLVTYAGKSGYYFNGDKTATGATDDFKSLALGRVMDKALRITYTTYVNELEDDLEVNTSGYPAAAVVKGFATQIERAIEANMIPTNISGVSCEIDPAQNLLANSTFAIKKLGIRPKGYSTYITVNLAFTNPLAE